jgi:hypothetical protein
MITFTLMQPPTSDITDIDFLRRRAMLARLFHDTLRHAAAAAAMPPPRSSAKVRECTKV